MKRYGYLLALMLVMMLLTSCVSVGGPTYYGNLKGYVYVSIDAEKQFQQLSTSEVVIAAEYLDPDYYMPLDGANVKIEGMQAVKTGHDGSFYVTNIPVGRKVVTITDDRLREQIERRIDITQGDNPKYPDAYGFVGGIGHYIVIGISKYPGEEPIIGPADDARLIYETLYENNRLAGTGELLLNNDATWNHIKNAIYDAIDAAIRSRSDNDYLVLYFSGDTGGDFIFPYDHENYNYDPWENRIFDTDLEKWLGDFPGHVTVIVEGPDSGSLADGNPLHFSTQALLETDFTVITSTQAGKEGVAIYEDTRISLFTHFLAKGIETGDADNNGDKEITAGELYDYIRGKMAEMVDPDVQKPFKAERPGIDPIIYRY